jgi:putative hydrolase of the HAD superfamily
LNKDLTSVDLITQNNFSLFVDDSINLLYVAQTAGIGHLLGVKNPDSKKPMNEITQFEGVSDFSTLIDAIQ